MYCRPKADGTIPEDQQEALLEMGAFPFPEIA